MNSRKFVKVLCANEALKYENIAEILAEKTGRHFTRSSLSDKLCKDTLRFTEAFILADALGYDLILTKRKEPLKG